MAIDIGLIAYNKYKEQVSSAETLPEWRTLDKVHQDAWRHAACAVLEYIRAEREQYEKDKAEDNEAFPIDW